MPYPFDDDNPFQVRRPQAASHYPVLPEEEEMGLLRRLGQGALSGIGALGKFLDETFGGRAVRGLLAGKPRELLSVLPLSDTLGLSDPNDFHTGRQVLEKWGALDKPEPGLEWGDVAGFGFDIATNPLTYFSPLGMLNPRGKLWAKTDPGSMPRGIAGPIRGPDYAAEQLAKLEPVAAGTLPGKLAAPVGASIIPEEVSQAARAAGMPMLPRFERMALEEAKPPAVPVGLPPIGPPRPAPGPGASLKEAQAALAEGVYPQPGRYLSEGHAKGYQGLDVGVPAGGTPPTLAAQQMGFLDAPGPGEGTSLGGAFGFKFPFMDPIAFGTGPRSLKYAETMDRLGGWIRDLPVIRSITKRLAPAHLERYEPENQAIARDVARPAEKEIMRGVRGSTYDLSGEMAPALRDLPASEANRIGTLAAENRPVPQNIAEYSADVYGRDPQLWAKMDAAGDFQRLAPQGPVPPGSPPMPVPALSLAEEVGKKAGAYGRGFLTPEAALGMPNAPLDDYAIQQLVRLEGVPKGAGPGAAKGLTGRHASQIPRTDLWKEFPGGQTQVNDLFKRRTMGGQPLLAGAGRLHSDAKAEEVLLEAMYGTSYRPALSKPQQRFAEDASNLMKAEDPRRATLGYFVDNPIEGVGVRGVRSSLGRSGAEADLEAIRRHAKPLSEFGTKPSEPVPEFLRRAGLTGKDAQGESVAEGLARQRIGLEAGDDLSRYGVESRVADDLLAGRKTPYEPGHNLYDKALNAYRSWLYGVWPAAQVRNRLWGVASNWLKGIGPIEQWRGSRDVKALTGGVGEVLPFPDMPPGLPQEEIKRLINRERYMGESTTPRATQRYALEHNYQPGIERLAGRVPEQGPPQTEMQKLGKWLGGYAPSEGQSFASAYSPRNFPGAMDDVGVGGGNVLGRQMGEFGGRVENLNRGSMYIALRRRGYSPKAADLMTGETHHLYQDLTNFEKGVARRLALFPTFSLRNAPQMVKLLGKEPAKLNALIQASSGGLRGPEDFVPPYLSESTAIPLGSSPEGYQRYLSGFGFGYEDDTMRAIGSLMGGRPDRFFGALAGQLAPPFKLPLETATGVQLHTGRKLEDLRAGTTATALAGFNEEYAPLMGRILAGSPASRAVTTLDKIVDERKDPLSRLLNVGSGVRVTDVDLARQKEIATRALVEDALRGRPGFGQFEKLYVKPEKIGGLSQEEVLMMALYTQLQKKAEEAAKARKVQQGPLPGLPR